LFVAFPRLNVELEEENVSVLYDILFAFGAQQSLLFHCLLAAQREEVIA
jgi:hypothetical protein